MNSLNSTSTPSKSLQEYFTIPGDLLMEILSIVVNNGVAYQIKTVNLNENSILLYIPQKNHTHAASAIDNIGGILKDYNYYISGIPQ
jgi:hypothetical protein